MARTIGELRRPQTDIVRARYGVRYLVDLPGEWVRREDRRTGTIYDLSGSGCFLATDIAGMQAGMPGRVGIVVDSVKIDTGARVIWVNGSAETDRPPGFGMQFSHKQKKLLKRVAQARGPLQQAR